MQAMVLEQPGPVGAPGRLALRELPDPVPGPGEVRIDVAVCAVCRTDLQIVEGDLAARQLPIVPGHQVVGIIVSVGPGVDPDLLGRRVGVAWIASTCGHCRLCTSGRENLCDDATFTGWDRDGGFATSVTARADFTYPVPDGFADVDAAPLLCGGAIGYRSLRIAGIEPGGRLGLYGFGASATCVIQIARYWGCEVFVATRSPDEQARARSLGATWAGGYDDAVPEQLDAAITFAPAGDVVIAALRAIGKGGTVAINAIHLDRVPTFSYDHLWWERSLRSVANVTRRDVTELLELATRIPITTRHSTFDLADAGAALDDLAGGRTSGAAVLHMPDPPHTPHPPDPETC